MKRREFLKFSAAASVVAVAGLQSECISKEVVATGIDLGQSSFDFKELYVSPETMKDIMNWSVDCMDEHTRKEIFTTG